MSGKRITSAILAFWIGLSGSNSSIAEVNSVYISSRLDPNAIIITEVDIVFIYDVEIAQSIPGSNSAWYSTKRQFTQSSGDAVDVVNVFIPQGFDSVMATLPARKSEAVRVVVFAYHDDPKTAPQDITELSRVVIEIDEFGILLSSSN